MKTIKFVILLFVFIGFNHLNAQETDSIKLKFILYDGLTSLNTSAIQKKLNNNAGRIFADLQVESKDTFKVHIWGNNESYLAAQEKLIGQRFPGSSGYVLSPNDLALLNTGNVVENAEHEFAHCVTLHINPVNLRRWLWEAVAIYESGEFVNPKSLSYLVSGNYPTINDLDQGFNTGARQIYSVGYIIMEFIINEWGKDKSLELIKAGGDVQPVLGISESKFHDRWENFVKKKYFGATDISVNLKAADKFLLIQNYPNPFNPETVISYQLPVSSQVELKVFDIIGREVTTLINEEKSAGNYKINFDGSKLTSGVYIYKFSASSGKTGEQFTKSGKMMLLK